MPSPEAEARREIDRQLEACGWMVQDFARMNLSAAPGVAVREFKLQTGPVDYLLYADGKVIGVVEAKPAGHTLSGVEIQSARYTQGLADLVPAHRRPIPFAYESTGAETWFTNGLEPDSRSREVFTFHRPGELLRLVKLDPQLRGALRSLPTVAIPDVVARGLPRLWPAQEEAIRNLERSLSQNRPRALIQMATGSGKTFTACSFVYRLIKFANAKRILFLVDRNNLGRQANNEFQQYQSPYTRFTFTQEFNVQHLHRNTIDPASRVVITTIQRLYSILKGEEDFDAQNEEGSLFEAESPLAPTAAMPVEYNPSITECALARRDALHHDCGKHRGNRHPDVSCLFSRQCCRASWYSRPHNRPLHRDLSSHGAFRARAVCPRNGSEEHQSRHSQRHCRACSTSERTTNHYSGP